MHAIVHNAHTVWTRSNNVSFPFVCYRNSIDWIDERAWVVCVSVHRLRTINSNKMQYKIEIQAKQMHESHQDFMHTLGFDVYQNLYLFTSVSFEWHLKKIVEHKHKLHHNLTACVNYTTFNRNVEQLGYPRTCKCFSPITQWKCSTSQTFKLHLIT